MPIIGLALHHGGIPGSPLNGLRRYMCTHRLTRWCARMLREPTSFKLNWLGCYNVSMHVPASADAPIHSENSPGAPVFYLRSTISTGPSCLSVGAHVHYLLSCRLHLRKRVTKGWDLPPHSAVPITYIMANAFWLHLFHSPPTQASDIDCSLQALPYLYLLLYQMFLSFQEV